MFPDFLVDVIERLGTVNKQGNFQKSDVEASSSSAFFIPTLRNGQSIGMSKENVITSAPILTRKAFSRLEGNNNDVAPTLAGDGGLLTTQTPLSYLLQNGISMVTYYDQSGYSFYDDDWDPITQAHTVRHSALTTLVHAHDSSSAAAWPTSASVIARNRTMSDTLPISKYWEAEATYVIIVILFPVLLAIGTFGNWLTYVVLQRKAFTDKTAASWLFKCLAVMCTICLWVGLPRHWLRAFCGFDIRQFHFLLCILHRFTLYCVMDITTWIIVSISADRLVAVLLPFKAHFISTPRNAKRIFLGLCIFFAVFNAHIFFTYGRRHAPSKAPAAETHALRAGPTPAPILFQPPTISYRNELTTTLEPDIVIDVDNYQSTKKKKMRKTKRTTNHHTTPEAPHSATIIVSECHERDIAEVLFYNRIIHPWMSFAMYVIGPFCFMLASSIIIARKLAQRRAFLKKSTTQQSKALLASLVNDNVDKFASTVRVAGQGENLVEVAKPLSDALDRAAANNSQRSTTVLLFVASVEFLVTATPAFFFDILEKPLKQSEMFTSPKGVAQFQLFYTFVRLLLFSNFALHFFLFCLSTHRFRHEVIKVVFFWRAKKGNQRRTTYAVTRENINNKRSNNLNIINIAEPSSSSSEQQNAEKTKPNNNSKLDAVWRFLSSSKVANKAARLGQVDDGEDTASVSNNAKANSRPLRQIAETASDTETLEATPPTSTLLPKLTTVDENGADLPALVCSSASSEARNEFLLAVTSPSPATSECQTGTTSTVEGCGDVLVLSRNSDDFDDGCYDDYNSGGAGSLRTKQETETSNVVTTVPPTDLPSTIFVATMPPSAVMSTSLSSAGAQSIDTAVLSSPTITTEGQTVENHLLSQFESDAPMSTSRASYVNTVSDLDDDELRMELLCGGATSMRSSISKDSRYYGNNNNFINNANEPLVVTVINGNNSSRNQSIDDPEKQDQLLLTGTYGNKVPLAKLDSDFFRLHSRNSVSSSSPLKKPKQLYRLTDSNGSFNSMASHLIVDNRGQQVTGGDNSNNHAMPNNSNYYYYYYCYNNNNQQQQQQQLSNPLFSRWRRKATDQQQQQNSSSSVIYVYLSDPLDV